MGGLREILSENNIQVTRKTGHALAYQVNFTFDPPSCNFMYGHSQYHRTGLSIKSGLLFFFFLLFENENLVYS